MATLEAKIQTTLNAAYTNVLDLSSATGRTDFGPTWTLSNGTGANQANAMFSDTRTLSASATESLDMAASLADMFGTTLTFTKIKAVIVRASTGNTNSVQVTRPASNGLVLFMAASDGIALTPGAGFSAIFPDANGVAVTAGTGDLLTLTNSAGGTSVTYDIIILGVV
jgi:hypothetical protein